MDNTFLGKIIENVRKHRNIKLVTTERRRNYLVSENFSQKIYQQQKLKKTETLTNKPVCLGVSILELKKILMYQFWFDCVKPKYDTKAKLCYIDTDVLLYT